MKFLNRYTFFARYIPGLITLIPFTLIYFFIAKEFSEYQLNDYFQSMAFIFGVSGTFILTFFSSMIVRELGCYFEKKYFKSKLGFPSTYLMLFQDNKIPKQIKLKYGNKVQQDFELVRLTETEEMNDKAEALAVLNQASRIVSTKYQQHEQVKDANISYGFVRNVSGGLFLSVPASITGIIIGIVLKNHSFVFWASVSTLIYVMLGIFHKEWIINNGEKYAEKLFSVYLSEKAS